MITRLVSLGNVIIDIVAEVEALPERGGDVLASRAALEVGGGFNLMAAAARQGLEVGYAGALDAFLRKRTRIAVPGPLRAFVGDAVAHEIQIHGVLLK